MGYGRAIINDINEHRCTNHNLLDVVFFYMYNKMSNFDTLFNYTQILSSIDDKISLSESEFVASNLILTQLTNLDLKYQVLAASDIEYYTYVTNMLSKNISDYTTLRDEVIYVQSLASDTKNVIYEFYTTYIEDSDANRDSWMKRLPFNLPGISNDMGNLMADMTIGTSDANCVVSLIYNTYQPSNLITLM